jgi:hypothetical protein
MSRIQAAGHRALLVQGAADGAVQRRHDVVAEVAPKPAGRRAGLLLHQPTTVNPRLQHDFKAPPADRPEGPRVLPQKHTQERRAEQQAAVSMHGGTAWSWSLWRRMQRFRPHMARTSAAAAVWAAGKSAGSGRRSPRTARTSSPAGCTPGATDAGTPCDKPFGPASSGGSGVATCNSAGIGARVGLGKEWNNREGEVQFKGRICW